ncbi:MAG: alpha/beta fold hydrolase [Ignavibacteriales bacterium]|nr:alpha/beta fold hydrolase [Ignavibacteriales bacterium]
MNLAFHSYGKGRPFLILHGLLGSSDNWHTLSKKFGDHFHVFTIDARNHGKSPHSDEFSYDAMAQDIKEFLQQHGLTSVSLLGHSMGGKTAMTFALKHQDLVERLVVVDIAPRNYGSEHDYIFDAMYGLKLKEFQNRKQIDESLAKSIPAFSARQFLMKNLARDQSGSFVWKMNLDGIHKNYSELNKAIESNTPFRKPALFIRGGQSTYIADSDIDGMKRLFPRATMVTIRDAGHWVHADAPDEFGRVVLDFLLTLR